VNNELTEFFECPVGVRQGCMMSPILFSLFINQVATYLDENGIHGIQLLPGLVEIFLLLFADDIVLLSNTARGLQNQIDMLDKICRDLFLNINKDKTKVMVFRKGGFLGKHENWKLDGNVLEVVNEYNYLGFCFTTKMSFAKGTSALSAKGKRACFGCIKGLIQLPSMTKGCFFHIFDTQVQPVLLYASEIWGLSRLDNIEKIHTMAIKRFLNVPAKVPNKFVYGETARYPLFINSVMKCIRYWLRILKLDETRLPKQAYRMLVNMDNNGKKCWVSGLRQKLFELGLGYAWLQQGVACEKSFISLLKQRLKDAYIQEWDSSVQQKDLYARYRTFKFLFRTELYLEWMDLKCFRDCVTKLRLGTLPLKGAYLKNYFGQYNDTNCIVCKVVENEKHFVCECKMYVTIREKYLKELMKDWNSYTFTFLLRCNTAGICRRLGMYVYYALKMRGDTLMV
jgi:hypothetical protein